ncbi:substrate-binding domain-containing protein [Chondromyces crocatus]|uniref:PBP domain-containing protein n=1 Tax=Chondromyces crocatus TaxID=52 RepID=A0A0K1EIT4_CHOCO|nr:substrate-binding domain-containing protein [Chondromyces crocatus]AKT40774.1 uncharacterized protein CMC5_049300 [Chondromyces crocatus]
MQVRLRLIVGIAVMVALLSACSRSKEGKVLRLSNTTSLQDSGLLAVLLPAFEAQSGHRVEVTAVGSGKALEATQLGQADMAVTHAPSAEVAALAAGRIGRRTPFMHNEFVIVGPAGLVAVTAGAGDVREAMRRIAGSGRKYVSRGDGSGTHQREEVVFESAGIPTAASFVVVSRAGMAETLVRASKEGAFALSDKATFLAQRRHLDLVIVFQGDSELRNTYSVLEPPGDAEGEGAQAFVRFLRSVEGRALIGQFGVKEYGEPLFTPAL